MRTISVLALVAWAVVVPGALRAADLTLALDGSSEYDSNAFRSSNDEKSDVLFRIRPWARLADNRGPDLRYALTYALPIDISTMHSNVDDVDQQVVGDFNYHLNDRWELFGGDGFRYLRSELRTNLEGTGPASGAPFINQQRNRTTINDASMGTSYQFTPRLQGTARLEHDYFDPNRDDRSKNWMLEGSGDLSYVLTPKHRVGGGVMLAHQKFDEIPTEGITASTSDVYQVFGTWRYAVTETLEFSVSAGPSVIRVDQDDPDSMKTMALVPSEFVGPFTASGGLVDRNNNPIPQGTNFPNGALVVGDFNTCQRTKEGTPVLSGGKACPLNVVLDATPGADDGLINQIANANATVINSNPKGQNSTDVTVFADVVLRQNWTPDLQTALEYRREQGNASGLGGAVVGDTVSLSNTWNWTEKWQFSMRGDWGLRNSVSESSRVLVEAVQVTSPLGTEAFAVPIAGVATGIGQTGTLITQRNDATKIDTMRWGVATRATHFFTRNTSGYLQFTYNQQTSKADSLGDPSDFKDYLVIVGVQHVFEPIKLW